MSQLLEIEQLAPKVNLYSGQYSHYLGERIAAQYGQELGKCTVTKFSDGELSVSYDESIRGSEVYIINSTSAPSENLMELLMMIDAAKRASARFVTVVIPYFGYARQDRKDRPRVAIGAKLMANLLTAAGATRIITMDLHAGQIQGFFDFPVDHLDGAGIFIPYIESQEIPNLIFSSPDVGGLARTRPFAHHFGVEMVVCDKQRKKVNEVSSMQVIGDVRDKNVVLVDDLIDTAGTLTRAAQILMEKGARSVRAVCTHAVLSGPAYERIENSHLTELAVTDTLKLTQECSKIKVLPTAKVFAEAIKRVHYNESISSLFIVE